MRTRIAPTGSAYHAVLALALASSCAYAHDESNTTPAAEETELAPVTVSAHEGTAVPYDQTGVSVTVLDVAELKNEGIYSLTEALTTVPGVYVQPGGGGNQRGNVSTPIIRGMNADRYVAPMMDGMLLGSGLSSDGLVASNVVARTPLFSVGTLELLRGAQGAAYGSGAMAGVLYMETPEGQGDPSLTLFNEGGSFDSYTGSVIAQGKVKDSSFFLSATYDRTNNDLRYADGSKPTDKHAGKFENRTEAIRLDQALNERTKVTFTYRREDASYRYFSVWGSSIYSFETNLATLRLQSHVNDRFDTGLLMGYYGSRADFDSSMPTQNELNNIQLEWRNAYRWNDVHRSTAGVAWRRSDYDSVGEGGENGVLDSIFSFFAEHRVEPVKNWNTSLALRLDQSCVFDAQFTARAATSYKFNRERSRVFASVGRGYAAPSSLQKSNAVYTDPYFTTWHGNPDLKCESNRSLDLGAEQEWKKNHYLSATLFWVRTENGISADYYSGSFYNADAHRTSQGVELAMRGTFEKHWNTGYKFACTLARPKDSGDTQMPATARRVWSADVHTSPTKKLTTGMGLAAASGRVGFASERLDNYITLRWYAKYDISDNLSVHLRVENLTNQKFVTEGDSYTPGNSCLNPGTAVYAGCTLTF